MPNYFHTTLAEFISRLKESSGDLAGVFWTDSEWKLITQEALLTFGAISGFFKSEIELHTQEDKRMYDLFLDTDALYLDKIKPTLTYGDILAWLNRDLIESISVLTPISDLFTLDGILKLIKKHYEAFQLETNLILAEIELPVVAQNNEVVLPDKIIDIVHAQFVSDDFVSTVNRQDEQEISYFDLISLTEEHAPQYYSTVYSGVNKLKLYPIPIVTGVLKLIVVVGQDVSVPLTIDTIVNLPNNLVPYLKYGIESEIFSQDGLLNDPVRANYCEGRWKEGLQIGRLYSSILTARANGLFINTDSLINVEDFGSDLVQTDNPPSVLGLAGFNIFEVDNLPSDVINSLVFSIIGHATIPINDGDQIDIEISYIKPLLDYCLHIAQMKCGAGYLQATTNYLQNFIKLAISHNSRLQNRGITYESLISQSKKQEKSEPRLLETV